MRIFSASLATETNTFSPLPTGLPAFESTLYFPAGQHPPKLAFFSGPLHAARERAKTCGWTVLQGLVAGALPAGLTTRQAYESLRDQILADLRDALPVDVVALGLHGAMVADGYEDCEGDLLQRVRAIVGPDVAVGATLDPHGNLSAAMVAAADALVIWKEYPHTDIAERAFELIDLLVETAAGRCRPVPALVDCQMIAVVHTTREPGLSLVARQFELAQQAGVLSVNLNHGFPWADVPEMGTKVLVYADAKAEGVGGADGAAALAQRSARTLADEVWALRESLRPVQPGIDAVLDQALASTRTPVVIADGADNAGAGSASDSTFFLRRMLERGINRAALGPIWDAAAVGIAFNAGVGARLAMRLGGKIGPASGAPIDADVQVMGLVRHHRMSGLAAGERLDCGDAAWLRVSGAGYGQSGGDSGASVDVVLVSLRHQAMGTDLFTGLGCTLADQHIVVVKSSQHFYAHFSQIAGEVLYGQAPGTSTDDWDSLPYRKIRRPKWPLADR